MINFTFRGHKISIRNDDWRKLKERFDPENAKEENQRFLIKKGCPLCKKYRRNFSCEKCPLDKFSIELKTGCGVLINSIIPTDIIIFFESYIEWNKRNNAQARRQLKAILRRMEKIEAEQEEK